MYFQDEGENAKVDLYISNDDTASFDVKPSRDHSQAIIINKKPLDYEKQKTHFFSLTATSKVPFARNANAGAKLNAKIDITIIVDNVDEPPMFTKKTLYVPETQKPGTKIWPTNDDEQKLAEDPEGDKFR